MFVKISFLKNTLQKHMYNEITVIKEEVWFYLPQNKSICLC